MAKRKDYENCCEALTTKNQRTLGLAAEAKKLREILASLDKVDAALKTAPKGREKYRSTAADKRFGSLQTELAYAKALHSRLKEVTTRFEVDAKRVHTDLQDSQARLVEVKLDTRLAREDSN